MLRSKLLTDITHKFTLIFGVRFEYGILYRPEFEELTRKHPNFRFWPTLTRPEAAWTGRRGRVVSHLIEAIEELEAIKERPDVDVYVCGLKAMVDDVRKLLKEKGFDRKRIIYEKYD
jgi:NAD(P)H-flavin reductase